MHITKEQFDEQLHLLQIFKVLKRYLVLIIVTVFIFILGAYIYTNKFNENFYESSGQLIVEIAEEDDSDYMTQEFNVAEKLAENYSILMNSHAFLEDVAQGLSYDTDSEYLKQQVKIASVNNSNILKVNVIDKNEKKSMEITSKILELAPKAILDDSETPRLLKVLSETNLESVTTKMNAKINLLLAAVIGTVASIAFVLIRYFTDSTFRSETQVEKFLSIPVIGVISNQNSTKEVKKYD